MIPTDTVTGRVLINTVSNYGGENRTPGCRIRTYTFILHRLGAADYGLWLLAGSIAGYGSLFDFGVASALVKYVSEYRAKHDMAGARSVVATALWLYVVLGLLALCFAALVAPHVPVWFQMPGEQHARVAALCVLMGFGVATSIPCTATSAILAGLHRFDLVNLLSVFTTLGSAAGTVAVLAYGGGLFPMVAAGIAVPVLVQPAAIVFIRRLEPELALGFRNARRDLAGRVLSFSTSMFLMDISSRLLSRTDEIVIAAFFPVSAIAPYALARRLGEMPQVLADQFMRVLMPLASELHARNDSSHLRTMYLTGSRVSAAIALAIGIPVTLLAGPILSAWVGPTYAPYAYLVIILGLSNVLDTSQWPAGTILQGMGRHRPLAIFSLVSALASVGLAFGLAPGFGLAGIAMGRLVPVGVASLLFILPYTVSVLGLRLSEVLRTVYLRAVRPAVLPALLCIAVVPSTPVTTVLVCGAAMSIYGAGYWFLGADDAERRAYRGLAKTAARQLRKRSAAA